MSDVGRWVVVVGVVILVVVLLRYARGPEHHRGDDEGAWGPPMSRVTPG